MDETNFIALVYPEMLRVADGVVVRYFCWCDWLRRSSDSKRLFAFDRAFIEPSRPYSIMPHGFAQRHDLRLLPVPAREFGAPPQARVLGLADATARAVVLRFNQKHTAPECADEDRTCGVTVWHQAADASPQWNHPVLGGDFLLEHRLRLFIDYGRLEYAPIGVGGVRFDSLVACGYLENAGNGSPPNGDNGDDPFAGFPRPSRPAATPVG